MICPFASGSPVRPQRDPSGPSSAATGLAADDAVPYPAGYRNWYHVKSMVIEKGYPLFEAFGGIHHLYANQKARQTDNAITEGARKVTGVMRKDASKYAATGGWGFEGFGGGNKNNRIVGANAATACYGCHTAQKDHGYVFSKLRD